MDFLRLTRSRSGSSANKKRSPLPSPSGRRTSGGDATHHDAAPSTSTGVASSHASDQLHAQRGAGATLIKTTPASPTKNVAQLEDTLKPIAIPQSGSSYQQQQQGSLHQIVECTFPSLLSPPNPAFLLGSEARGILINARRPSTASDDKDGGAQTRSSTSLVAASMPVGPTRKRSSLSGSSGSEGTLLAPTRPPHLRTSVSSDSMLSTTKHHTMAGTPTGPATISTSTALDPRGRGRIRFAPLPDPRRPRSHSTGRDIWFDDDSENHIHINTRDGIEVTPGSWSSSNSGAGGIGGGMMNGSSAQSNSLSMSLGDGLSGSSYKDDYSLSPSNSRQASHKRTSSTLSKLLQPLKLGRSKSRESDKLNSPDSDHGNNVNRLSLSTSPSTSLSQWMNGGESLTRSISTGAGSADIERQRKEEFRSSGVPLKKSSTQESSKSYSQKQPTRRILYPSVAQGGVRKRDIRRAPQVEEPEFVEWTNPSARNGLVKKDEDEDDGSGMAWLKKRRAEREKKAKEDAEVVAAATPTTASTGDAPVVSSGDSQQTEENRNIDSTSISVAANANQTDVNLVQSPTDFADQAQAQIDRQDANSSPEGNSDDSKSDDTIEQDESEKKDGQEENEDEGSDSDDSDQDGNNDEEHNDDLSAAEIEEEERLAEEARRTTGGASRELYHSHEHQAATYTFEAPHKPSRTNSLNLPPFERQLSYTSSFKSEHLPRSIAASHPGDWPLKDHVVPPC